MQNQIINFKTSLITSFDNQFNKKEFDFQNNAFDFIRLILALVVVVFHATKVGDFPFFASLFYFDQHDWDTGGGYWGGMAVNGFFLISGFLITKSAIASSSLVSYFQKRFLRIYPAYLISLLLTCCLFVPLIAISKDILTTNWLNILTETVTFFFRNLFIETPVTQIISVDSGYINGSYWTLLQEFRAYILVGGLVYIGSKLPFVKQHFNIIFVFLAIFVNLFYLFGSKLPIVRAVLDRVFTDFRFFVLFSYFLVGGAFYLYHKNINWSFINFTLSIVGILCGFYFDLLAVFLPVCGGYTLLYLSQILPFQTISKKFGDMTYGVYVYSSPILSLLLAFGVTKYGFEIYTLLAITLSLLAGYLSYHLVEKPFLSHRNKT